MNKATKKQYPKRSRSVSTPKVADEEIRESEEEDDEVTLNFYNDQNGDSQDEDIEEEQEKDDNQIIDDVEEEDDLLDEYFEVHSQNKDFATSDKTLSRLANPKMNQEELREHLTDAHQSHVNEIVKLHAANSRYFDRWMFEMLCGFNILVYGLGSKRGLLDKFRESFLTDYFHLIINGLFPNHTPKNILNMITSEMLDIDATFKSHMDQCKYIKKSFDGQSDKKLFIIVHNIDGVILRSKKLQSIFAHIGSSKNIHIIASLDHINSSLIWDQSHLNALSWLWYDATTFEPYTEETLYNDSVMVESTGGLALSSLEHVMRSLTKSAKGIFKLLAEYHMENHSNNNYNGMPFLSLYMHCREKFLANSDTHLRAQLTEFKDHKMIKFKRDNEGTEHVVVLPDVTTLRNFFNQD